MVASMGCLGKFAEFLSRKYSPSSRSNWRGDASGVHLGGLPMLVNSRAFECEHHKGIPTGNDDSWLCPVEPVVRRYSLQVGDERPGLMVLGLLGENFGGQ